MILNSNFHFCYIFSGPVPGVCHRSNVGRFCGVHNTNSDNYYCEKVLRNANYITDKYISKIFLTLFSLS